MSAETGQENTDIILQDCVVFADPYEEADEQLKQEREEEVERQRKEEEEERKKKMKKKTDTGPKVFKQGVGKYINTSVVKRAATVDDDGSASEAKKKKTASYSFGDFSAW